MKKFLKLFVLGLASIATLAACGGGGGGGTSNIKIAIKDVEGKTTLKQDMFKVATTYICFDTQNTNLGSYLPSEVILKGDSSSVNVEPYGYSREIRDYKWKATFMKAGDYTITATLNNKEFGTVSYKVEDDQHADITYRSPVAENVTITYMDGTYETPVECKSMKIGNRYMHVGFKGYTYFIPEDTEGLYRRYVCNFDSTEWKKSRLTYNLSSVLTTIYSNFIPNFSQLKYKSKTSDSLIITTVTSNESLDKSYSCTKYEVSDDVYYVCDIPEFCLCLKTIDGEGTKAATKIDYTVTSFPAEPTSL